MYTIRRARVEDADTLLKLARMVHFINLPPDKEIILQKIIHSRNSFLRVANAKAKPEPEPVPRALAELGGVAGGGESGLSMKGLGTSTASVPLFMFVLEDVGDRTGPVGTSQVLSRMGGPENPNVSFRLEKRAFFSTTLQTGTTQMVARMHLDESGPSEIGGLILQPSYRGHKRKLGRFLSFVRFHYMGLHQRLFAERVLAEMMAPITADGNNLLWDYLGRRFVPLSYDEADRFCQYSREFITSLLPREDIYLSLLPPAARAAVGEVGAETRPARAMLERLGFRFNGFVDPFDGGPHLECVTKEIGLVRLTERRPLGEPLEPSGGDGAGGGGLRDAIVSVQKSDGEFFAVNEACGVGADGSIRLSREAMEALQASAGETAGVTPLDGQGTLPAARGVERRRPAKAKGSTAGAGATKRRAARGRA